MGDGRENNLGMGCRAGAYDYFKGRDGWGGEIFFCKKNK